MDVQNLPVIGYIDTTFDGSTINGNTNIKGWFLDDSGVSKIEVLVDGKSIGTAQYGSYRPDVQKVFPDYQNANSGYHYSLDTKQIADGQHTLTVQETGMDGNTKILTSMINIMNFPTNGYIDTPAIRATIKGDAKVTGWFLDNSGVSKIEVLVDGKSMGTAQYGSYRPDVQKVFPDYQNADSGYQFTLNTNILSNGLHSLTVQETGNNGTITNINSQVDVQNLPVKGFIDTPAARATIKGDAKVTGWFLDGSGVSKVEVLVDGKSMGTAQYGSYRPDVQKVFPDYQNANSGYQLPLIPNFLPMDSIP